MRVVTLVVGLCVSACSVHRPSASLQPLHFDATPAAETPLEENHFTRDRTALGEAELRGLLRAPVYLEANARIGVVPVAARYELDEGVPVETVPASLVSSLEGSGLVELATEVSTEWPVERGTAGLRELAARYRTDYLMLYRHRFVEATRPNPAAIAWVTIVAGLFVPGTTIESTGVLEATLFDVKTGTILFTIQERVRGESASVPLAVEVVTQSLRRRLLGEGVRRLSDEVLARLRRLEAARPDDAQRAALGPR